MALDLSALDVVITGAAAKPNGRTDVAPTAAPSAFIEDEAQPRREFDDEAAFQALVDDIRERGVLQPLIVRRLASGQLKIRFGARRLRAAIAAGLTHIPYIVTEDARQFDDYAQVAENQLQQPLQPLELAQFIQAKVAGGEKKKAVAARLHLDPAAVTHLLALVDDAPPLLHELYHSRRCRAPHLLYAIRQLWQRYGAALETALRDMLPVDRQRIDQLQSQLASPARAAAADADADSACLNARITAASKSAPVLTRPSDSGGVVAITEGAWQVNGGAPGAYPGRRRLRAVSKPRLVGIHHGTVVELLLYRAPSSEGRAWVRALAADAVIEVAIDELVLQRLWHGGSAAEPDAEADSVIPPSISGDGQ